MTTDDVREQLDRLRTCGPAFDIEQAKRAYAHLSWDPDRRAEQERESFDQHTASLCGWLMPLGFENDERFEQLVALVTDYKTGYLQRLYAVLSARSGTASTMITGGSGFNHKRNAKRLETERNRERDLLTWAKKEQLAIRATLMDTRSPEQVDDELWRKLKKGIDSNYASIVAIDRGQMPGYRKASFSGGIAASIRTQHKAGNQTMVDRMLGYLRDLEATHGVPAIGAKNAVWGLHSVSREAA